MQSNKKKYIIALFAIIVNSYDYGLFSFMVIKLTGEFFSQNENSIVLTKYFLVYASTIIVRPFASLIFGIIGDRHGRVVALRICVIGIVIPISAIAFIPSYEILGITSTVLFVICRIAFIIFLSGAVDGMRIYLYEKFDSRKKFFASGFATSCSQLGALIASFAVWLSSLEYATQFSWRIYFLIGGLFGCVVIYMRSSFEETEEFIQYRKKNKENSSEKDKICTTFVKDLRGILILIRENYTPFIRSIFIHGAIGGVYHFHIIFYGVYIIKILGNEEESYIELIRLISIGIYVISAMFSGFLYYKFNPKLIASSALIINMFLTLLNIFDIAASKFTPSYMIIIAGLTPIYTTALFVFLKKQFKTNVKYRLFSLGHTVGSTLISSTTPVISIQIWRWTNVKFLPLLYFILLMMFLFYQMQNKKFVTNEI